MIAVVLVVPGTLLSIAFGGIGAVMLVALSLDYVVRGEKAPEPVRRTPLVVQVGVGITGAAAIGGVIALAAWIM